MSEKHQPNQWFKPSLSSEASPEQHEENQGVNTRPVDMPPVSSLPQTFLKPQPVEFNFRDRMGRPIAHEKLLEYQERSRGYLTFSRDELMMALLDTEDTYLDARRKLYQTRNHVGTLQKQLREIRAAVATIKEIKDVGL